MRPLQILVASLVAFTAMTTASAAQMDCAAEFDTAISMIDERGDADVSMRVELVEMTLEAYQMCERGEEETARSLFEDVFKRADGN